jgi:lipoate-protein ligase A
MEQGWKRMDHPYPLAEWRLLHTGERDGATNMAIDEAVLEAVTAGQVPPTLRCYGWRPPCLSLGFSQPAAEVDREACAQRGWDIVRRPTGGQAILHVDELTYSVCAPRHEPRVAGGVVESYGRLAAGLLAGLRLIGLEPAQAKPAYPESQGGVGPACFDGPARYEITLELPDREGGASPRKLVGSAQSRRLGGILQHGTLPLCGEITRIIDGLAFGSPGEREAARARLGRRALTLETALGRPVTFAETAEAMAAGFARALNLRLVPGQLREAEWAASARIRAERYANDAWTFRR